MHPDDRGRHPAHTRAVAVVPRPLADAPAHGGAGMIAALLALVLLAGTAEALDVPLEPYRAASLTGVVGTVTGRIYAEARTPNGPVQPLTGPTALPARNGWCGGVIEEKVLDTGR